MSRPYIAVTALGGDLFPRPVRLGGWIGWCEWEWLSGSWVARTFDGGLPTYKAVRFDPRDPGVAHRIADVLRAKGHEVGHLLPVALGGRVTDAATLAPIPASCSFHGNAAHVAPLSGCLRCGGSGRVPFESDEYPPGTNACCCTCSGCRSEKVTIPGADVSALLLCASVAGVEAGVGAVRGLVGEWRALRHAWGRSNEFVLVYNEPRGWQRGWRIGYVGQIIEQGPETGPEGRAAADAALLRLGYAYLDPSAPFGVRVPFLSLEPL